MKLRWGGIAGTAIVAIVIASAPVRAQSWMPYSGFQPRVPVSAFARPAAWLDPARMHVSTSLSFGSGWSGGSSGLQVTSLSYQFSKPAWLEVSVGNAFGGGNAQSNGMFLEGIRLGFRPSPSTIFQIQYRDYRSPLQYQNNPFATPAW